MKISSEHPQGKSGHLYLIENSLLSERSFKMYIVLKCHLAELPMNMIVPVNSKYLLLIVCISSRDMSGRQSQCAHTHIT